MVASRIPSTSSSNCFQSLLLLAGGHLTCHWCCGMSEVPWATPGPGPPVPHQGPLDRGGSGLCGVHPNPAPPVFLCCSSSTFAKNPNLVWWIFRPHGVLQLSFSPGGKVSFGLLHININLCSSTVLKLKASDKQHSTYCGLLGCL